MEHIEFFLKNWSCRKKWMPTQRFTP